MKENTRSLLLSRLAAMQAVANAAFPEQAEAQAQAEGGTRSRAGSKSRRRRGSSAAPRRVRADSSGGRRDRAASAARRDATVVAATGSRRPTGSGSTMPQPGAAAPSAATTATAGSSLTLGPGGQPIAQLKQMPQLTRGRGGGGVAPFRGRGRGVDGRGRGMMGRAGMRGGAGGGMRGRGGGAGSRPSTLKYKTTAEPGPVAGAGGAAATLPSTAINYSSLPDADFKPAAKPKAERPRPPVPAGYRDGALDLSHFSWFHGQISNDAAMAILSGKPGGAFIVRNSSQPSSLIIALMDPREEKFVNVRLSRDRNGRGWLLDGSPTVWPHVSDIIGSWPTMLIYPINPRDAPEQHRDPMLRDMHQWDDAFA